MAFPLTWQRVCPLVIPRGKIYASSLVNFPVMITAAQLPAEMVTLAGANAAQSDGGDIRFSADAAGQTQLPCEIVYWAQNATPANAKAVIWVQVPELRGDFDDTIYVWYKPTATQSQPAAGAAFGSQAVWDSNYKFVWHAGANTTLSLADSTANGNTLTNTGSVTAAALSDGRAYAQLSGSNRLTKTSPTGVPNSGPMTLEGWLNPTDVPNYRYALVTTAYGGGNASFACLAAEITTAKPYAFLASAVRAGSTALTLGGWNYVAQAFTTGASVYQYLNGVPTLYYATSYSFAGAAQIYIGDLDTTSVPWKGGIHSIRISNTLRSTGWLATCYANQSDPATFIIPGTPYAPGAYATPGGFYGARF